MLESKGIIAILFLAIIILFNWINGTMCGMYLIVFASVVLITQINEYSMVCDKSLNVLLLLSPLSYINCYFLVVISLMFMYVLLWVTPPKRHAQNL